MAAEGVQANIIDELTCPVDFEPLRRAVSLIPCAHKINEGPALEIFGPVDEKSGFCKENKPCPKCRTIVVSYAPDHTVREIATLVFAQPKQPAPPPAEAAPVAARSTSSLIARLLPHLRDHHDPVLLQLLDAHIQANQARIEQRLDQEKLFILEEEGWDVRFLLCREKGQMRIFRVSQEGREIGSKRVFDVFDLEDRDSHCLLAVSDRREGVNEGDLFRLINSGPFFTNTCVPHIWGQDAHRCYALYDLDGHLDLLRERRKAWPRHTRIMDAALGVWDFHQLQRTLGQVHFITIEGREFVFDLSQVVKGENPERAAEDVYALGKYLLEILHGKGSFKEGEEIVVPDEEWPIEKIIVSMLHPNPHHRPTMREVVLHVCAWQALQAMNEMKRDLRPDMVDRIVRAVKEGNKEELRWILFEYLAPKPWEQPGAYQSQWYRLYFAIDFLWKLTP